jgi:ribonuclease HI
MTKSKKSKASKKNIPTKFTSKSIVQGKLYVVIKGRIPGIYQSWDECQLQVKGFSGAIYKSFKSMDDALNFRATHMQTNGTSAPSVATTTRATTTNGTSSDMLPLPSICPPPQQSTTCTSIPPCENRNLGASSTSTSSTTATTTTTPNSKVPDVKVHVERTITTVTTETVVTKTITTKTLLDDANDFNGINNMVDHASFDTNNTGTSNGQPSILPTATTNGYHKPTTTTRTTAVTSSTNTREMNLQVLSIHIQFDGGSRCNPGKIAGAGAMVRINTISSNDRINDTTPTITGAVETSSITTYHIRQFLGDNIGTTTTNNQAEYSGLLIALRVSLYHIQQIQIKIDQQQQHATNNKNINDSSSNSILFHVQQIHIQGDSQLIINQLNNVYQCKNQQLKVYYNQCQQYIRQLLAYKNYNNSNTILSKTTTTTTMTNSKVYKIFTNDNDNSENRILIEHIYRHQNQIADGNGFCLFVNSIYFFCYCLCFV